MIDFRFRPIERWPQEATPRHRQKNAQFRVTYESTLSLLEYELARLGVRRAFISILGDREIFEAAYRAAAKRLHPDVAGEEKRGEWDHLQAAAAILRDHFERIGERT